MINSKKLNRTSLKNTSLGSACLLVTIGLLGCSSVGNLMEADRIDYKSATSKDSAARLDIPPDLTQLQRDNRYAIPEAASGTVTASGYHQNQETRALTTAAIAPKESPVAKMERDGSQRWLVVNRTPEVLWQQIKDFWMDSGFLINVDLPEAGVMETDWAENRAKIPQDLIRRTLGKVFDFLYSTGERDKFRTRLERGSDGVTEIYISHRGAQEELAGINKESTVWTARPSDPELEAEFLSRLMARLSEVDKKEAVQAKTKEIERQSRANLVNDDGKDYITVDEAFDRTWRRVGLALDRVGFTVEDRDRSKGLYFVRYVDQNIDAKGKDAEKGFLSRVFSSSSNKEKFASRYQIVVKEIDGRSVISVLDNAGKSEPSSISKKILSLLYAQLK